MSPYVSTRKVKTKPVLFALTVEDWEKFTRWCAAESRSRSAQAKKVVLEAMEAAQVK